MGRPPGPSSPRPPVWGAGRGSLTYSARSAPDLNPGAVAARGMLPYREGTDGAPRGASASVLVLQLAGWSRGCAMPHQAQPAPQKALHLTLRERLDQVAAQAGASPAPGWSRELAGSLELLRATLLRHFRRDEDERLNAAFLGSFPRFELKLQDLLSEHGPLVDRLDSLRARAVDLPATDRKACLRLGRDVGIFLVELERHEVAERELLVTANCTDLGTGD